MIGSGVIFILLHFVVCVLWFALLQKPVFMMWCRGASSEAIGWSEVAKVYLKGYYSDVIAGAYLTGLPLLIVLGRWMLPRVNFEVPMVATEVVVALIITLVSMADVVLYPHWRYKLDKSVFPFLRTPKEAFGNVSVAYLVGSFILLLSLWVIVSLSFIELVQLTEIWRPDAEGGWRYYLSCIGLFVMFGLLVFIAIRGLGSHPYSPNRTFFSTNVYFNHSALNPLYNMIYSLTLKEDKGAGFHFVDDEECSRAVGALYPRHGSPRQQLLAGNRPNVLFIIWESLSARFVESLGGCGGVMPSFEQAAAEGVLFSGMDCSSYRTERALACIFSGLPGQPTMNVVRDTPKLPHLPSLPRLLAEQYGYHTIAIHGGPLTYMNQIDYYIASGHKEIHDIKDYPAGAPKCVWGIHDHYMAEQVAEHILGGKTGEGPWWITFQTLSSHTPYKVPEKILDNKVENAFAYTDRALGHLLSQLKSSEEVWKNLLVVIVGDHGLNDPGIKQLPRQEYVRIPMLFTGGMVKERGVVDVLMSQTDIPATILGQLGVDHSSFPFSRDVLADSYREPFTFHSYNNGFLLRTSSGFTDYDNTAGRALSGADEEREKRGHLILQSLYSYIDSLGRRPR